MNVVFAGTPAPAVPSLRALLASPRHDVLAVVTRPPARAGRGRKENESPVATVATDAGLPVLTPRRPSDPEFVERLAELAPDCCPVVAYGALIPPSVLAIPAHGWVNLHFSLLPAWRGAAPVQHALLHGDDVTGASTFLLEEGLDTGPVFGVVTESIGPHDTAGDLLDRLAVSGAGLLLATLDGIEDGSLVAAPQPGAWTTFRGERLKLGPVRLRGANDLSPGEIRADRSGVAVGTGSIAVDLGEVQPSGKRPMPAADWARGARITDGERFG